MTDTPKYDVCFSFAYEDNEYVKAVTKKAESLGLEVFYSPFREAELWGTNLYDYLTKIYSIDSRYCVMFISKHYADSLWTDVERQAAQARAFLESETYLLPARFDKTEIPGLNKTIHYIDLNKKSSEEFTDIVYEKVTGSLPSKHDVTQSSDSVEKDDSNDSSQHQSEKSATVVTNNQLIKRIAVGVGLMVLALFVLFVYLTPVTDIQLGLDCNVADPPITCLGKKP